MSLSIICHIDDLEKLNQGQINLQNAQLAISDLWSPRGIRSRSKRLSKFSIDHISVTVTVIDTDLGLITITDNVTVHRLHYLC